MAQIDTPLCSDCMVSSSWMQLDITMLEQEQQQKPE